MKLKNSEQRLVMKKANPLSESFGEPPRTCMTNSSRPLTELKEKGNPDLPSVCSNYWPPIGALSLCFNHLVLSTFWQCRSAIPQKSAKPIASIHHTIQGQPLGFDTKYLALADRNMQVRFSLKVVWES